MNDFPNTGRAGLPQPAAKAGSALLIVLGFLSFMVVSAVAFSIYMRSERMPSSALRRTVATRQLVRAALSEAMSRVDDAVRGDPFPGLRDPSTSYQPRGDVENFWEGRVFMPPNPEYDGDRRRYAPATETVSTLTLEGLGYVPAPLMNDARFLGRATWTAAWNGFPYDAGRYAFVALNVSDYFDVNCMYANRPRTSNPNGRISLAYLCSKYFNENSPGGEVSDLSGDEAAFDKLSHDNREGGNDSGSVGKDAPYVSMLDFSLALGNQTISEDLSSLFYVLIHDNKREVMYTENDKYHLSARRQPFVTDSWATNETYAVDISTVEGQPFGAEVKADGMSLQQIDSRLASPFLKAMLNSPAKLKFARDLRALAPVASMLYDYLDHDDVPLSLAWPCVERVPMFTAVQPAMELRIPSITRNEGGQWQFVPADWLSPLMVNAVYAFPFKRNESLRNDDFKAQALVRIFLARKGLSMRAREGLGKKLRPSAAEWSDANPSFGLGGRSEIFCITLKLPMQQLPLKKDIKNPEDAGAEIQFMFRDSGNLQNVPLVTRTEKKNDKTSKTEEEYEINVSPLGDDGEALYPIGEKYPSREALKNAIAEKGEVQPYLCLWMRIVNGEGKTVDMVPAVVEDDGDLNSGGGRSVLLASCLHSADDGPLMRFTGQQTFSYAEMVDGTLPAAGVKVEFEPKAFYALDPRFNWAPEDWYASSDKPTYSQWLEKTETYLDSNQAEVGGCENDIFCAVSNMGFLQSLGELAFLPRLTDVDLEGALIMPAPGPGGPFNGVQRSEAKEVASIDCAWRNYTMDHEVYDALKSSGIGSAARENLVNPYTPSRDVFMAALANTPCDYWAAGVGLNADVKFKSQLGDPELPSVGDAKTAIKNYAFSALNSEAKITAQELEKIAGNMMERLRDPQGLADVRNEMRKTSPKAQMADAWEVIWDNLNWMPNRNNPDFKSFLGVQLSRELYGIDRKFLYSYWRDCLGNRQQLFLIFLRAESNAIGGIGEGTPGQKGGRAVALVWRNPAATTDASSGPDGVADDVNGAWNEKRRPHQMRVLFYHQFD